MDKELVEVKEHVATVFQVAQDLAISNELEFIQAGELSKQILDAEKKVTARKEAITAPLNEAIKSARDLFKPLEVSIAFAKSTVKAKRLAWTNAEEARIALELSRVEARVEKGTMRVDTGARKVDAIGTAPTAGVRLLSRMRITDEALIPRQYLVPDLKTLTDLVVRQRMTIPGCEFYEEKTIV